MEEEEEKDILSWFKTWLQSHTHTHARTTAISSPLCRDESSWLLPYHAAMIIKEKASFFFFLFFFPSCKIRKEKTKSWGRSVIPRLPPFPSSDPFFLSTTCLLSFERHIRSSCRRIKEANWATGDTTSCLLAGRECQMVLRQGQRGKGRSIWVQQVNNNSSAVTQIVQYLYFSLFKCHFQGISFEG